MRNVYNILVGKSEEKGPLGKHGLSYEDSFNRDFKERGRECVARIHLAQDRDQWWALMNTVINLRFL
jgi:hypothetical protein